MRDRRGSYVGFAGTQGSTVYEDSTYPNTVLLMHFDGAENGTTFTDVSLNNFAVTRSGTVTTTVADFKFGTGSVVFKDVSYSYLVLGTSPAGVTTASRFNFGLEDYTAEAWVLLTAYKPSGSYVFDCNANTNGFNLYIDSAGRLETTQRGNVALLNPTVKTSQSYTAPVIVLPQKFGAAADPYYANVVLATPMDLGSSSTTVVDVSPTPKTLTFTGGARIATDYSTSNGAAAYIDGSTGSSILTPSTADFDLPADFVIELRVRFYNLYYYNSDYGNYVVVLLSRHNVVTGVTDANTGFELLLVNYNQPTVIQLRTGIGTTAHNFSGAAIPASTWHHIAVVRSNGWITAYLNGVQYGASVFDQTPLTPSSSRDLSVGQSLRSVYKNNATLNGHIDDLCITKNSARDYVTAVTPLLPTAAFPDAAPADPYFSSVQLLLHMDGTGNVLTDSSATPKTIAASGNVTQTTAQSVWGGKSASFDGNLTSYWSVTDNAALEFGSGPVVIEMWIRTTQTLQYATLLNRQLSGFFAGSWTFVLNSSTGAGDVMMYMADYSGGTPAVRTTGVNLIDGFWHHIAYVKTGNLHYIFVDGILRGSGTANTAVTDITAPLLIGNDAIYTPRGYVGYMDDLRVTVGSLRNVLPANNAVLTGRLQRNMVFATTNHNLNISDSVYLQFPSPLTSSTDVYVVDNVSDANQFSVIAPTAITAAGTATVTALPPLTGTYSHAGTEITVTCANHGFVARNSVSLTVLTGSGRTGTYVVARVVDVNTFVLSSFSSLTATGFAAIVAAVPLSEWTHVALVRRAGVTTSYLNGKPIEQTAVARNYSFSVTNNIIIGTREGGGSEPFVGNIDELAVSNIARYSAPFTPPVAPYSEATARVSGFWSQREAEQYQRLGSWVGENDPRGSNTLSLWLDAADASALWDNTTATTSAGNLVSNDTTSIGRWQDKSNYARHFTRPGATSGLKRVANGKNGLPVVRFGATSNEYFNGPTWNTLTSANGFTAFIVAKVNNVNLTTGSVNYGNTATLLSASYQNQLGFSTTQAVHYMHSLGVGSNYTPGTWAIFTMTYNATGTVQRILVNNAGANTITGVNQNSTNAVSLGYNNYSGQYASTDIAELLFFNVELSTEMQTAFYNYLQSKWAIT